MNFKIFSIIIVLILIISAYYIINSPKVGIELDEIVINSPKDLEQVYGVIKVGGDSKNNYDKLYYKIDSGEWVLIDNTKWEFELNTANLDKGVHIIYVKAGEKVKAVRINVV